MLRSAVCNVKQQNSCVNDASVIVSARSLVARLMRSAALCHRNFVCRL